MPKNIKKINAEPIFSVIVKALSPGFLLGCLHLIFTYSGFYLNSGWDWIDIPLHITGGACVAFAAAMFIAYAIKIKKVPPLPWYFFILSVIGVVILVGVVWEFYEFLADVFYPVILRQPSNADTMKDLADDLIGGFLLSILVGQKILKNNSQAIHGTVTQDLKTRHHV
jgi:hypothetical protein